MSMAGWSGGKLSATKLYHSVSTSGPRAHGEAELAEDVDDLVDDLGDRVRRADPAAPARHGEIEPGATPLAALAASAARRAAKAASNCCLS